jgi:hypothetical protein
VDAIGSSHQFGRRDPDEEVLQCPELVEQHLAMDPVVVDHLGAGVEAIGADQSPFTASRLDGYVDGLERTLTTSLVQVLRRLLQDPARRRPPGQHVPEGDELGEPGQPGRAPEVVFSTVGQVMFDELQGRHRVSSGLGPIRRLEDGKAGERLVPQLGGPSWIVWAGRGVVGLASATSRFRHASS